MKPSPFNRRTKSGTGDVCLSTGLLLVFALYLAPAFADKGDFYLGGGPSLSFLTPDTNNTRFSVDDDTDIGGKLFLGYDFSKRWALEVFYAIPGEADMAPQGTIEYNALYGLGGVFSWSHNQQGLSGFLKAGGAGLDVNGADISIEKENDVQLFIGGGGGYNFARGWGARLEYEYFSSDVQLLTLSVVRRFLSGAKPAPVAVVQPVPAPMPAPPVIQPEPVLATTTAAIQPEPQSVIVEELEPQVTEAPEVKLEMAAFSEATVFDGKLPVILFPFGSVALTATGRTQAGTVVEILRIYPELRLEIQGYSCNVDSESYNQILSGRRAQSVVDYLVEQGVDHDRLEIGSYGERRPVASNATEAGRARNRRVEFMVLKSSD